VTLARKHRTWTLNDPPLDRIEGYVTDNWCSEALAMSAVDELAAQWTVAQRRSQAEAWTQRGGTLSSHADGYGSYVNTSKSASDEAGAASHSASCYRKIAQRMLQHC